MKLKRVQFGILVKTIKICNSPIEVRFLNTLVDYLSDKNIIYNVLDDKNQLSETGPLYGLSGSPDVVFYVRPQHRVDHYRVDFCVIAFHKKRGLSSTVLVECDGHEFHEKTKEQAQQDKARDRFLQSNGYYILHFTGSEIHRNPVACVEETFTFLIDNLGGGVVNG